MQPVRRHLKASPWAAAPQPKRPTPHSIQSRSSSAKWRTVNDKHTLPPVSIINNMGWGPVKVGDWGGVYIRNSIQVKAIPSRVGGGRWRGGDERKLNWSFHWACCAPNAALDVIGSQKAVHYRGWARQQNRKGWKEKENVSFFAPCLRPSTIMGQELIKRAVDATVFPHQSHLCSY